MLHDVSQPPQASLMPCPSCWSTDIRPLSTPGRWIGEEVFEPVKDRLGLTDCRTCGLVFVNPRPDSDLLEAFYDGDTYECHVSERSSTNGKSDFLLSHIEPHLGADTPRRVLDYGAGGGGFLLDMKNRGWEVMGFEPGAQGRAACIRAGLRVTSDTDSLPDDRYGLVTMNHVFEHIEEPYRALDTVRRVLAPGGLLFVEVPNIGSLRARLALPALSRRTAIDERYRAFPIHLAYYDRSSLTRLLDAAGWDVIDTFTVGLGIDELVIRGDNEQSSKVRSNGVRPGTRRRRVWERLRNAFLELGLGENLSVIARPRHP